MDVGASGFDLTTLRFCQHPYSKVEEYPIAFWCENLPGVTSEITLARSPWERDETSASLED
jgi:hypothetical protein